jgi:hypothetical protein
MPDSNLAAYLDYMRAHIRAREPRCLEQLSNGQLHDAFHTLPRPAVPFGAWLQRTGRKELEAEHAQSTGLGSRGSPAPSVVNPDIEAQNAKGLAALRALQAQGFPITIKARG